MNKKTRRLAILATLTAIAIPAHAVYVNPQGTGEVLLYPFYTVENAQDTYVAVVNTTQETKAVRVRLRESMNSAPVLDFNLYLAPHDHWAGVITRDPESDGGLLKTTDNSCTVPKIPAIGAKLHNRSYAETNSDGGPQGLERTREGHIEIIEMGVLYDEAPELPSGDEVIFSFGAEDAVLHGIDDDTPANCEVLVNAWIANGDGDGTGEWAQIDSQGNTLPTAQRGNTAVNFATEAELRGGLYGYGVLINPMEGTNATYDAVALEAFTDEILHAHPGSDTPNLSQALPYAKFIERDSFVSLAFNDSGNPGLNAVSSVLMHNQIANDFVLAPSITAGTDWVVTLPTKRLYVNGADEALAPFTNVWTAADGACEEVMPSSWNRETSMGGLPDEPWSPAPPGVIPVVPHFSLCHGANVVSFLSPDVDTGDESLEGYSSALYPSVRTQVSYQVDFYNGWARMHLSEDNAGKDRVLEADDGSELYGLSVIGFAVQKYANTTIDGVSGSGAFYSGVSSFKTSRELYIAD